MDYAFNYTDEGSVSVRTIWDNGQYTPKYKSYITVEAENVPTGSTMFGIVISDTGVGISEKSISHVFERYFRVADNTEQHIGSGIGLALVKSMVILHKGRLILSSERKTGTEICVMYPIDVLCEQTEINLSESYSYNNRIFVLDSFIEDTMESSPINTKNAKDKIMLVDDNDRLLEMLAAFLSEKYKVITCANGMEATDVMEANMPDVIIADIMMPVKDGISLCKEVKENFSTSHIPVIMLTAKVGEENQIEGMKVGADLYISKPVSKEVLLLSVDNLIAYRERLRKFYLKNIISDINYENTRDQKFMDSVIECIMQNMTDSSFDVTMLATTLCVSRSNLYNKIKALTGVSPVEFLRKYRINKAAKMLIETDLPAAQIIECVGIESASYFSRVFKQEFGETPSEYQKHRRGKP